MRALITGGAGYLGSMLVSLLLAEQHEVRVLDNLSHGGDALLSVWSDPRFEFIRGDIRETATLRSAVQGCNAVIHLAAIVGDPACARQPDLARATNLDASYELIEESQRAGVERFVFASTCSNYGKMKDADQYVDENSELRPVSLYAETKVAVEKKLLGGAGRKGWCPTPLRFSTLYGVSPRMRFDLTVNEFTLEMVSKKYLQVFGEQFWRPYVHVRDAARAIQYVLNSPSSKVADCVFNVGATDQNFQKQQLVDLIRPYAPDARVEYVHRNEDPRDYRVCFTRFTEGLGFKVSRTVPEGIAEIAQLVKDNVLQNVDPEKCRN